MSEEWQRRVWRPILNEPPMCTYMDLSDGTYSIDDLADMHEIINLQTAYKLANQPKGKK